MRQTLFIKLRLWENLFYIFSGYPSFSLSLSLSFSLSLSLSLSLYLPQLLQNFMQPSQPQVATRHGSVGDHSHPIAGPFWCALNLA